MKAMGKPPELGGAGRNDILSQLRAMQIMWVYRYIDPSTSDWKRVLDTYKDADDTNPPTRKEMVLNKKLRDQFISSLPSSLGTEKKSRMAHMSVGRGLAALGHAT